MNIYSIFVGDVKLSDLRKVAEEESLEASLHSGVLTCAGIRLHKPIDRVDDVNVVGAGNSKRWVIEGPVSDQYYHARELLMRKYHAV